MKKYPLCSQSSRKGLLNGSEFSTWMQSGGFAFGKVMLRVTREKPWYLPCAHRFVMVLFLFDAVGDTTWTNNQMRKHAHTQVELQIGKHITNALWVVNLLCPCSMTLHNEQGVFQCQHSVLQLFAIKAQQQQIDTLHSIFEALWWFCKMAQQLGNYLHESMSSLHLRWQQMVFGKMWQKKQPGTEQIFLG